MPGCPSRPRTATGAVFPHAPHSRWRRGSSRRRQTSHTALPCSSNPAAGLALPQLAQGLASCQERHRWHTPPPSPRNSGLPARPQTVHAGMARAAEPRPISSRASRPATGGAPAVSAPGSAASASASCRRACPPGATTSTAASITAPGSDGSAADTAATTVSRRQRGHARPPSGQASSCPDGQRAATAAIRGRCRSPGHAPAGAAARCPRRQARQTARPPAPSPATGSTRSPGPQSRMSHSAASVARLSRSGTPVTSR